VALTSASTERERRAVAESLALLEELLGPSEGWKIAVRFWDESQSGPQDAPAVVVLNHPWTLRSMLWPPDELALGEAFIFGDVDVVGDLEAVLEALMPLAELEWRQPRVFARLLTHLLRLPAPPSKAEERDGVAATSHGYMHSKDRDRQSVTHHYDVSNRFYQLWLDERMQYSCGYFFDSQASLDDAQAAKVEHICKKLRLREGDRLLDIGCGWGGLLDYAATKHGVEGLGVTLSEPQTVEANRRFLASGVADRVHAQVTDYRELRGEFDAIASVGMVEHVGEARLPEFFERAYALLRPGGVFLLQNITTSDTSGSGRRNKFIDRYVFPDGELVPISQTLFEAERAGFEVRDVENLREHYAETLRHWVRNLEAHRREAVELTDEVTYRVWLLYMTGCAINFDRGNIGLAQTLLHKPTGGHSGLPPTRADWYATRA
jgi:cyclopropane-fatty-acyl-phospholipid synthase